MCGRFVSASPPHEIAKYFDAQLGETLLDPENPTGPNYNVAPTNEVFVVLETGETRRLETMRWGLVPFWAKDLNVGAKMINARAETIATKNAFKRPLAKRRFIIAVAAGTMPGSAVSRSGTWTGIGIAGLPTGSTLSLRSKSRWMMLSP